MPTHAGIRVAFHDDRMVVENPGGLVPGMTVEDMQRVSKLRNPAVARVFRDAGLVEQWGTGVRRVFQETERAGLPEPRIEEIVDRVRFIVFILDHSGQIHTGQITQLSHQDTKSGHQVGSLSHQDTKSGHQGESPSHALVTLLTVAADRPVSRHDLLGALGISNDTRNFKRHIEPLLAQGLLARTIPDRPTSRNQRYSTTEAGKGVLLGEEP